MKRNYVSLGAAVFMTASLSVTAMSHAQQASQSDLIFLQDRMDRIEAQLRAVQNFGRGSAPSASSVNGVGSGLSNQSAVRIDVLENQVRQLTGQVQQLTYQIQQLRQAQRGQAVLSQQNGGQNSGFGNQNFANNGLGNNQNIQSYGTGQTNQNFGTGDAYTGNTGTVLQPLNIKPKTAQEPELVARTIPQPSPRPGYSDGVAAPSTSKSAYDSAYARILQRDYDGAQQGFTSFLQRFPDDRLAGNAQYWLGESHYARGRYRDAANAFLKGYQDYKNSQKAPDSLLKLGISLKQLGETKAACASFGELDNNYPNASDSIKKRAIAEGRRAGC